MAPFNPPPFDPGEYERTTLNPIVEAGLADSPKAAARRISLLDTRPPAAWLFVGRRETMGDPQQMDNELKRVLLGARVLSAELVYLPSIFEMIKTDDLFPEMEPQAGGYALMIYAKHENELVKIFVNVHDGELFARREEGVDYD